MYSTSEMDNSDSCGPVPSIENKIPKDIHKSLLDLRKYESKIINQLNSNPQLAEKFLTNPAAVLSEMGIPIDNNLSARLKNFPKTQNFLAPRTFCLLDGSKIRPKINVKFIPHQEKKAK